MHKRKKSGIWTIVIVLLFLYSGYTVFNLYKVLDAKQTECNNMQNKINEERGLNKELLKQKEAVNSDEYIEKVAREKLGLVKNGEKVFVDVNK